MSSKVSNEANERLTHPPIVEAIVDIQCDMPAGRDVRDLEIAARDAFRATYPRFQPQYVHELRLQAAEDSAPNTDTSTGLHALQFLHEDGKQLVQARSEGYSFNRLAPYTTLDDYLGEIERTWCLFVRFAEPIEVREVRLRYINRILLPIDAGGVELDDFLSIGPRVPSEPALELLTFLNQQVSRDRATGSIVQTMVTVQAIENARLPVILDIMAAKPSPTAPGDWGSLVGQIDALRAVKNQVFRGALTSKCLRLFA